jgi:hypothetical protein
VIASVLAVPLAMTLGFSHVLLLAAAVYLVALLVLPRPVAPDSSSSPVTSPARAP